MYINVYIYINNSLRGVYIYYIYITISIIRYIIINNMDIYIWLLYGDNP